MGRSVVIPTLLLCAASLAGCVASDEGGSEMDAGLDGADEVTGGVALDVLEAWTLAPPVWEVGEYWTFRDSNDNTFNLAVSEDQGDHWVISVDHDAYAFLDATSDISTYGPQRKSDLAGSQGNDRVQFFQWPLEDGASWTTPWDGEPITVVASAADEDTFAFEARRSDGSLYATYTYSGPDQWFSTLEFYNAQEESFYRADLTGHGYDFSGELIAYALEEVVNIEGPDLPVALSVTRFDQSATHTDVFLHYALSCTQGVFSISLYPEEGAASGQGHDASLACPHSGGFGQSVGTAPDESWGLTHSFDGPVDGQSFRVIVLLRTKTVFTIDA